MHSINQNPNLRASPEDIEAIIGASLDYIEGWYNAQPERMARCLHPDLMKRTIERAPEEEVYRLYGNISAQAMVDYTKEGGGSDLPEPERIYEINILDVFRHIASVKTLSPGYVDYLQLTKIEGEWVIVNILFEWREGDRLTTG